MKKKSCIKDFIIENEFMKTTMSVRKGSSLKGIRWKNRIKERIMKEKKNIPIY